MKQPMFCKTTMFLHIESKILELKRLPFADERHREMVIRVLRGLQSDIQNWPGDKKPAGAKALYWFRELEKARQDAFQ